LAVTCKLTVFDDRRKRSHSYWSFLGAIAANTIFGVIAIAAQFQPEELHSMGARRFASLVGDAMNLESEKADLTISRRTIFIIYLSFDTLIDLCTVGLMGFEISHLQISAKSRNPIVTVMLPRFTYVDR